MKSIGSIPLAPGKLPLLGHTLQLVRDPQRFLTSLPTIGDLVRIRLGPFSAVVVCTPELTSAVLRDDRTFDKGGPLFDRGREVFGDGLVVCPQDKHRRLRALAQPAFHHNRMPGYAATMTEQIARIIDEWADGQVLDIQGEMMTLAARVTVATMFSDALTPEAMDDVLAAIRAILEGIYLRALMPPPLDRLPTAGNRRYHRARLRLREILEEIIARRRADGEERGDLLSSLLAARDPDSEGEGEGTALADAEILEQIVMFVVAGSETTASTLAWALSLLAEHPDINDQMTAEVDSVLAGAPATYEDLLRLETVQRVVTETLRLRTPGWIFTRITTADTRLGGHAVAAGTHLVYSPYLIHHRDESYPEPDRFIPDRWNKQLNAPVPREAVIPFGAGPRKCIGDQFGTIEAVLALAAITARWQLRPVPGSNARPALAITLRPQGLRMRVSARSAKPAQPPAEREPTA